MFFITPLMVTIVFRARVAAPEGEAMVAALEFPPCPQGEGTLLRGVAVRGNVMTVNREVLAAATLALGAPRGVGTGQDSALIRV